MVCLKAAVAFVLEADQPSRNSFAELMPQMLGVRVYSYRKLRAFLAISLNFLRLMSLGVVPPFTSVR